MDKRSIVQGVDSIAQFCSFANPSTLNNSIAGMNIKETLLVVLVTVPDEKTALALSRKIISERLAACVNILPGLRSIYSWQGNIEDSSEQLLLIKTPRSLFQPLQARVLELHPYDTPEVVALQAADVSEGYLAWVLEETSRR